QGRRHLLIHPISLSLKPERCGVLFGSPLIQGVQIRDVFQALDLDLAHVADCKVGVQRLTQGNGLAIRVVVAKFQLQARTQSNAQAQVHQMGPGGGERSEEHTSELQSRENLVCRLLLEKKKKKTKKG